MFVERWMTPNVVTVAPDVTVSAVALAMMRCKFKHFPVAETTTNGMRLVGIVSKYDIARGFPSDLNPFSLEVHEESVNRPVSTVMTKKVITTAVDTPIEEAARLMRTNRIGALPVIRDLRLVGIITESDLFDAFISITAAQSGGTRILVESDAADSPVSHVIALSQSLRLDLMSTISFHENRLRHKDLSIFRFNGRVPAALTQEITKAGFRIVSYES